MHKQLCMHLHIYQSFAPTIPIWGVKGDMRGYDLHPLLWGKIFGIYISNPLLHKNMGFWLSNYNNELYPQWCHYIMLVAGFNIFKYWNLWEWIFDFDLSSSRKEISKINTQVWWWSILLSKLKCFGNFSAEKIKIMSFTMYNIAKTLLQPTLLVLVSITYVRIMNNSCLLPASIGGNTRKY